MQEESFLGAGAGRGGPARRRAQCARSAPSPGLPAVVGRADFEAERAGLLAPGEGTHPGRRRDRRGQAAPAHGGGRRQPHADRAARAAYPARRVRRAPAAHRLLLHVVGRASRGRAVRRLHVLHPGWPQQCSITRTDGGSPAWPPVPAWPGGRPIVQCRDSKPDALTTSPSGPERISRTLRDEIRLDHGH
jgi:hypothetical protein